MNASSVSRLVHRWVALYTRGLPVDVRLARTDEIDSDLWSQHDEARASGRSDGSLAVEVLARWLFGIAADVAWRLEQGRIAAARIHRDASRGTRVIALLAILGGLGWGVAVVDWAVAVTADASAKWWLQPAVAVAGVAGLVALSLSLGGIGYFLLNRYDAQVGLYGFAGATCGLAGVFGAPAAIVFLPPASIVVIFALARVSAIRWPIAWIHAGAAPGIYVGLAAYRDASLVGVTSIFVIVYCVTWIAVGLELLGGLPAPRAAPSGS